MKYKAEEFLPLLGILAFVFFLSFGVYKYQNGAGWYDGMRIFMGCFFLIFGLCKIYNLHGFVDAYQMYDLIAERSQLYAYCYPFIEVALGIAYLMNWYPFATNIITLIISTVSAVGVLKSITAGREIMCACLGAVFHVPMTWVSFLEDAVMAIMAAIMLTWTL